MMSSAAVFLDRDGVLTEPITVGGLERPAWTHDELRIIPGVAAALDRLRSAGFVLVAITNQPDIARGQARLADVEAINVALAEKLGLDAVYLCPHDGATCECRKPQPGMILRAASDLSLDPSRSWLVGDRWVDIAAGHGAGVRSILLKRPGSWDATSAGSPPPDLQADAVADDLAGAARVIVGAERSR
jgi:D-glycero-D-manno-heptose 1,7-bisphosphate phosphatase